MKKLFFPILFAIIVFSGCTRTDDGAGKLVIKVTDDPFNISYVESATVKISKVEIRKAGDHDESKFLLLSEDTVTFDLLELRNGVTADLLNLDVPQGSYDLIRLYVEEASLKLKNNAEAFTVKVPSGHQSGIKIFIRPAIRVEGGLSSELLLDFDLSKSFVMRGNMAHSMGVTGFIFKPCIRAVDISSAGRITGMVMDTADVKITNARVWIAQDTIISTAFTDTLGHYAFIGIPSGIYRMLATKEGYDTLSFEKINVYSGNRTVQNFVLKKEDE